jgi:hypothetical protein
MLNVWNPLKSEVVPIRKIEKEKEIMKKGVLGPKGEGETCGVGAHH